MPRPYSNDLRARVIEAIEAGASRREAADRYRSGGKKPAALRPCRVGGSTSPLEEHAEFLLGLIVEQPDLTLDEMVAAMRKKRIPGSRSAVWRFFERLVVPRDCLLQSFKQNGTTPATRNATQLLSQRDADNGCRAW